MPNSILEFLWEIINLSKELALDIICIAWIFLDTCWMIANKAVDLFFEMLAGIYYKMSGGKE